jgi:hypothetical protein
MRAKAAGIEMSMYTKPTNLLGFYAELMYSLACESLLEVRRASSECSPRGENGRDAHNVRSQFGPDYGLTGDYSGPKSASRRSPRSPFLDNFRVAD